MGRKQNPYPYYKIADCIILTSDYEGYPVVFMESKILNKPIITTKVSDYQEIDKNYGIVVNKDIDEITKAMEQIINNGFNIKEKFDYEKYNNTILCKVKHLIGD